MQANALVPEIFKSFKCTAQNCRNSCCANWNIHLSKQDYMRAVNAKKSKELKAVVDAAYKRKKSVNDAEYAEILMDAAKGCPMLDATGLCTLQLECGHTALCETCKSFPRLFCDIAGDTIEGGLSTGCEEVVGMLMQLGHGVVLENVDEAAGYYKNHATHKCESSPMFDYYWDIKTLTLAILQEDEYSLDDRLLILGFAIKTISEMKPEAIPEYVDTILGSSSLSYLAESFRDIEVNPSIALGEFGQVILPIIKANGKEGKEIKSFVLSF